MTITNNAYTNFYNKNTRATTGGGNGGNRPPSDKQKELYNSLCLRKKRVPANINEMTAEQLGKAIEELLALPEPASPKQIEMLKDMFKELIELGASDVRMPSDKFFNTLTGGRDGSASQWIERTRQKRKSFYSVMQPSEEQLERLVSWYLCPDIPWEQLETKDIETTDFFGNYMRGKAEPIRTKVEMEDIFIAEGVPAWRKMTADEFREELASKLTYSLASGVLDRYMGKFYEWRRTRIQPGRIKFIRDLEKSLANLRKPKVLKQHADGEYFEDAPFSVKEEYAPVAYEPMPDEVLLLIDEEHAQTYIEQLASERDARELYSFGENITTYEYYDRIEFEQALQQNPKTIVFSHWSRNKGFIDRQEEGNHTFEEIREATSLNAWRNKEFNALNDFLFSLQAIAGVEMDGLREEVAQVFFNYTVTEQQAKDGGKTVSTAETHIKKQLRKAVWSQMKLAVQSEAIGLMQLGRIVERSEIASELYTKMIQKPRFAKLLVLQMQNRRR
mgnify:CR=1 FL=1